VIRPLTPATPVRATEVVTLRGLTFHVLVGILPHERAIPQPLEIDVDVWARRADRRQGEPPAVDYAALYASIATIVHRAPIDYLEDLVDAIAHDAMARERVDRVRVTARKPKVALAGPVAAAEVTLELERGA
jgi:FolB domain-containing protein